MRKLKTLAAALVALTMVLAGNTAAFADETASHHALGEALPL